jgi:hypothetical protein
MSHLQISIDELVKAIADVKAECKQDLAGYETFSDLQRQAFNLHITVAMDRLLGKAINKSTFNKNAKEKAS